MKENGHTHEKEGSRGDAEGAEGEESEPRKTQKNTEEDISVNSVPTFIHPVAQPLARYAASRTDLTLIECYPPLETKFFFVGSAPCPGRAAPACKDTFHEKYKDNAPPKPAPEKMRSIINIW